MAGATLTAPPVRAAAAADAERVVAVLTLAFSAVLAATLLLVLPYPRDRWLWVVLLCAAWDELEHVYILGAFLATGVVGTPGLLSSGGALAGGLPLTRPDLHFLYNLAETAPLRLAFFHQVGAAGRDVAARARRPAPGDGGRR